MTKLAGVAAGMFVAGICVGGLVRAAEGQATVRRGAMTTQPTTLGAFSVSLAVKDIKASHAFYEKLDFEVVGGDAGQNWLILRNGTVTIGLFQGMYDRNLLTFNPGWDQNAQAIAQFTGVREHQRRLKSRGLTFTKEADEKGTGPAGFMLADPDGNPILIDQHAPASLQPPAKGKRD
jgi:lactoylglutathione lyase